MTIYILFIILSSITVYATNEKAPNTHTTNNSKGIDSSPKYSIYKKYF